MADGIKPPSPTATKAEWREWAVETRRDLDWPGLSGAVCERLRRFPPLRHNVTVMTYMAMNDEIDLTALRGSNLPVRWVSTRTPDEGPLSIHEMVEPFERHRLGYLQPRQNAPHVDPIHVDIALIPGLSFDLFGNRLGHGRGYYDELLSRLRPATVLVGVVPSALVADKIPSEVHDVPVHWLAAEEGVVGVAR